MKNKSELYIKIIKNENNDLKPEKTSHKHASNSSVSPHISRYNPQKSKRKRARVEEKLLLVIVD